MPAFSFNSFRDVAPKGLGDFNPFLLINFQTKENFGKISYKWIPFCSFICFKLSFRAFKSFKIKKSLKVLNFLRVAPTLVKISCILVKLCEQHLFVTPTPLVAKGILRP